MVKIMVRIKNVAKRYHDCLYRAKACKAEIFKCSVRFEGISVAGFRGGIFRFFVYNERAVFCHKHADKGSI